MSVRRLILQRTLETQLGANVPALGKITFDASGYGQLVLRNFDTQIDGPITEDHQTRLCVFSVPSPL